MALVVRDGDVTVTLGPELEELARRALDVAQPVLRELEAELEAELRRAQAAWPVKTGASRDGLRLETTLGDAARVAIRGGPAYTAWVRPAGQATATAWSRYVAAPVRDAHQRLTKALGPAIVAALVRRG